LEFKAGRGKYSTKPPGCFFLLAAVILVFSLMTSLIFFAGGLYVPQNRKDTSLEVITPSVHDAIKIDKEPVGVSLFVVGDVMLGRTVMIKSFELEDYSYPFRKVSDVMREADVVFINLESPIVDPCPFRDSGYIFCTDPSLIQGLLYAGVDVVSLANNHILNYGVSGKKETIMHLDDAGIMATGLGDLVRLERNGITFGFLGFDKSEQSNPKLEQDEIDLITASEGEVDVLVVAMHWGVEYQNKALPGVRSLAREIIGYGADLIVGHHPHWVQDWEFIEGKPVFYSLGNFIFDQMWSEETKKGLAVKLIYKESGILDSYELMPTYMSSWAQPEFIQTP
jgi:poly-gamma-glutamate capsule biosynthesis protein CapA/YwtB (metallophosphatase superfamily)